MVDVPDSGAAAHAPNSSSTHVAGVCMPPPETTWPARLRFIRDAASTAVRVAQAVQASAVVFNTEYEVSDRQGRVGGSVGRTSLTDSVPRCRWTSNQGTDELLSSVQPLVSTQVSVGTPVRVLGR